MSTKAEHEEKPARPKFFAPLSVLGLVTVILVGATSAATSRLGTPYADRDTGPASRVGKAAWSEWAEQRGSVQLRDALEAGVPAERLYERDIARAITPELAGTARCSSGVTYDRTVDIAYDAARRIFLQARTLAEKTAQQLPAESSVKVDPPVGCWLSGGEESGTCIPVSLVRGEFFVLTCYLLNTAVGQ